LTISAHSVEPWTVRLTVGSEPLFTNVVAAKMSQEPSKNGTETTLEQERFHTRSLVSIPFQQWVSGKTPEISDLETHSFSHESNVKGEKRRDFCSSKSSVFVISIWTVSRFSSNQRLRA